MSLHFISFLLNVVSWLALGVILSGYVYGMKTWRVNKLRFHFTVISATFIGGLLAEFANGSPEFGLSILNLAIAGFAGLFAVSIAYPKYGKKLFKEVLTYENIFAAFIRTQLQTILQK